MNVDAGASDARPEHKDKAADPGVGSADSRAENMTPRMFRDEIDAINKRRNEMIRAFLAEMPMINLMIRWMAVMAIGIYTLLIVFVISVLIYPEITTFVIERINIATSYR
ncbi:MAG: hypothetical protein ISN28_05135 [Ectothiorhodospiraceae bacterium AqS1]|nr:hypothetical protein [Ectothiorhodospiraceae bacterium AqS1]MBF2759636.1 hypothetical protein [Ectothiorhodospiraceae bacterium AqS1]